MKESLKIILCFVSTLEKHLQSNQYQDLFFEIRHIRTKYVYFLFRLNLDFDFFIKPWRKRLCIWTVPLERVDLDCNFWGSPPFELTTVGEVWGLMTSPIKVCRPTFLMRWRSYIPAGVDRSLILCIYGFYSDFESKIKIIGCPIVVGIHCMISLLGDDDVTRRSAAFQYRWNLDIYISRPWISQIANTETFESI